MKLIHNEENPRATSALVNVSQVAELAEVGLSAVSNWRNRFSDFPRPVESVPGGRDLFYLQEVEDWLRERGRLKRTGTGKQHLYRAADTLRGELEAGSMTEVLGAALALVALGHRQGWIAAGTRDLDGLLAASAIFDLALDDLWEPLREIDRNRAAEVLALALDIEEDELPESFEWLLARYNQQQGRRGEGSSGETQVALLLALIEGRAGVLYDPAAGSGGFLLAAANAIAGEAELVGQEINAATARIARQRFLVHGTPVSLAGGDTLSGDAWPELRADLVVCDPPYQQQRSWPVGAETDPRWALGFPAKATDMAWLQHALYHLVPDGRAYVFLPPGSLFRGGRERGLRSNLLTSGAVEAVVSLPAGSASNTSIPLVLWILRRPRLDGAREPVLLVDATAAESVGIEQFVAAAIPRVASVVHRWRGGGQLAEEDRAVAAAVPIEELIQDDANMVPARWIHQELTEAQRAEQKSKLDSALRVSREARRALRGELELDVSEDFSADWVTVKRLVEDGLVEIVGGASIKPDDSLAEGIQMLRTRDIYPRLGDRSAPAYVSPELGSKLTLTQPGDIVVSPASGKLKTFVDREGGRALARPLQALRLLREFMDPEVVAAFLESARNRRFVTGSTYARISLRDLELPLLNVRDCEKLAMALETLDKQERVAVELAESAQVLRQTLVSLGTPATEDGKGV